jgi:hypothetical protein
MLTLSCTLLATAEPHVDPKRVHLVDMHPKSSPKNFLFRGTLPNLQSAGAAQPADARRE